MFTSACKENGKEKQPLTWKLLLRRPPTRKSPFLRKNLNCNDLYCCEVSLRNKSCKGKEIYMILLSLSPFLFFLFLFVLPLFSFSVRFLRFCFASLFFHIFLIWSVWTVSLQRFISEVNKRFQGKLTEEKLESQDKREKIHSVMKKKSTGNEIGKLSIHLSLDI